jgi:hypothetical protein
MIKNQSFLYLILIIFLPFPVFSQITDNVKKPKIERVSQAFGYLAGQEYSLNYIKNEFPQLENNVLIAKMAFKSTFGKSKSGMEDYLSNYLGEVKLKSFNDNLIVEFEKRMNNQTLTEEIANNFIKDIENRAKGSISSPILETLLSFQYADSPHRELLAGFTTTFKTKGHAKSKNTDWQIRAPKSWRAKEGDRPNIIQSFTDDFGDGLNNIMLMVKDMPVSKGTKFSNQEKNEFFTEKEMKIMVPNEAKFISFSKMTLDSNIGGMLEIEQTVSRLDLNLKMRMVQFMFIRGSKIYTLTGTVSSANMEDNLAPEMEKYLPLFRLVANSIVVNDQYK